MTVHVLHAGDGYTYLTRQVASHDVARERGQSLSSYYVHDGNPPGVWVGEGLAGLGVEGEVTEAQMKALFGEGRHPDAERIERELIADGASVKEALEATKLGRRFPRFAQRADDGFESFVEAQHKHFFDENGRVPAPGVERDRLRRAAAAQVLAAAGRSSSSSEVARYLAKERGEQRQAVAGYDLVFTPVKSVSVLWGLGDERVQEEVSAAHRSAWQSTMAWLETEAALTRVGAGGVAQVDTKGLVATAFDHIDSRSGDPNLHTHLAIANKVQGLDGKWRSLDGRVLHALGVAASERYNTLIEVEMNRRLGVRFAEQPSVEGKRPVREIVGIPTELRQEFSSRRASIEEEFDALVASYRGEHGHEPSKAVQYKLAQRATLATRQDKEEGVPLSARRRQWRGRAERALGGAEAVDAAIAQATITAASAQLNPSPRSFAELHEDVMGALTQDRAVWTIGHIQAQAQRVARTQVGAVDPDRIEPLAAQLVDAALEASLPLTPPELNPVPDALRRADRHSVYRQHAGERFTTAGVLEDEERIVTAARTRSGIVVDEDVLNATLRRESKRSGRTLNRAQRDLAHRFACGGHLVEAGIGPAGAGKTASMAQFAAAVHNGGGRVLGLAPSAAAAAVLADELSVQADTIHKLLHAHSATNTAVPDALRIDERTVILVDEAGMASTPDLAAIIELARQHRASVRLLGDPAQLQAIGAGGALRLVDELVGAVHLEEVHRFSTPAEAPASLALREGEQRSLDFYIDHNRTLGGTQDAMIEEAYANWTTDQASGKNSLMIAASSDVVRALSTQARLDRVTAGDVEREGVTLRDQTTAGVGDVIVTRRNDRRLRPERSTDFVKNGDVWTVLKRYDDGALRVRHRDHHTLITLPSAYVADDVELAYATTINRAQGMTVDTAHLVLSAGATREQLYTGLTRARHSNRVYVAVDELLDPDLHAQPTRAQAVRACLETVLERSDTVPSATATLNAEHERAASLETLVPQYEDAFERFVSVAAEGRLAQVVREAIPDQSREILDDEAWPALRARLLGHERAGTALPGLLAEAYSSRELATAKSIAQVLHWRVGEPPAVPSSRVPSWITPIDSLTLFAPQPDLVLPQGPGENRRADLGQPVAPSTPDNARSPEPAQPMTEETERVVTVNTAAWEFWRSAAATSGAWVREHLASRLLASTDAGHAPPGWTSTTDALRAQGFSDDDLCAAGISTVSSRGQLIDRFRDRLVLPVQDTCGRVLGFTARANPSLPPDVPKYLNSPETPAYRKSELLYGLDADAVERLRSGARAVLVEGAMDCAAVREVDPSVVPVAPCGTAVTSQQLDLLRSLAPGGLADLTVALDGDQAGRKAAARLWTMLTPAEAASVRAVALPEGRDPADLVAGGHGAQLEDLLQNPGSLTQVLIDQVLSRYNLTQVEQRVAAARDVAEKVASMQPASVAAAAGHVQSAMGQDAPQMLIDIFMTAHLDAVERRAAEALSSTPDALPVQANDQVDNRPLDGLDPAPPPEVTAWLRGHNELIAARLDGLVAQVEYAPPAWARRALRPVPADAQAAEQWRRDVRAIVAYRDRWSITSTDALPAAEAAEAAEAAGVQGVAYREAAEALTRVQATSTATTKATSLREAALEKARLRAQTQHRVATAREQDSTSPEHPSTIAERAAALSKARDEAAPAAGEDGDIRERLRRLTEQHQHLESTDDDTLAPRQRGPQR